MLKRKSFLAAVAMTTLLGGAAHASETIKMAVLEALSGPQSPTASLIINAVRYTVQTETSKPDYKGPKVEVKLYDTQNKANLVSQRLREAIDDGAKVIVQGNSSALAAQISEAVARYDKRHPDNAVLYLNVVAQSMDLTGSKCQFYHFRTSPNIDMVVKSLILAMKKNGKLGTRVYAIDQNYSFGQDINNAVKKYAELGGYEVVGEALHPLQDVKDFAPYVNAIASTHPDSVISGDWGNDLLMFLRATRQAGQHYVLGTFQLDAPGTLQAAGESALGGFAVNTFNAEVDEASAALAEDYKAKVGSYPVMVAPKTIKGIQFFLKSLESIGDKENISAKDMALAMENTTMHTSIGDISIRKVDHQMITPVVVSEVSKDAKYERPGTGMGFKPIDVISGKDAISPVQDHCHLERPAGA